MKALVCTIYKSIKQTDTYLFVLQGEELKNLPTSLIQTLGKLEHVMNLSLTEKKKLAQSNARNVIQALSQQGYYLQLPPHKHAISD